MEFRVSIKVDNDAYHNDVYFEVQDNLHAVIHGLAYGIPNASIMDTNGNKVGEYKFVEVRR